MTQKPGPNDPTPEEIEAECAKIRAEKVRRRQELPFDSSDERGQPRIVRKIPTPFNFNRTEDPRDISKD